MRVCHMDHELRWRGGQRQVLLLLSGLVERGVDATLVTSPDSTLADKAIEKGIRVEQIPILGEVDPGGIKNMLAFVKQEKFDILHTHTSHAHGVGAMIRMLHPSTKLIVHRRVDFRPGRDLINLLKYRTCPDRFIAISHEIKRILLEAGVKDEKIDVVHSSVRGANRIEGAREDVHEEFRLPSDAIIVGNIAALSDHKGHTYLIQAAKILCSDRKDLYFMIVGRGELEEQLKDQVEKAGLTGRVLFTGFRDDVERLLSAFDIFTMTSHKEGLCTSILDAMSVKVPVVATQAGGIPEIVKHEINGLLANNMDPLSIAECIVTVLHDFQLTDMLVENGWKTVKNEFSLDKMVDKTIDVYQNTLAVK